MAIHFYKWLGIFFSFQWLSVEAWPFCFSGLDSDSGQELKLLLINVNRNEPNQKVWAEVCRTKRCGQCTALLFNLIQLLFLEGIKTRHKLLVFWQLFSSSPFKQMRHSSPNYPLGNIGFFHEKETVAIFSSFCNLPLMGSVLPRLFRFFQFFLHQSGRNHWFPLAFSSSFHMAALTSFSAFNMLLLSVGSGFFGPILIFVNIKCLWMSSPILKKSLALCIYPISQVKLKVKNPNIA